jgi:succinate dehydrogenase/fumarate reductase flavoprotein subunit
MQQRKLLRDSSSYDTKTVPTTIEVPTTVVSTVNGAGATVTETKTTTVQGTALTPWLPDKWDYEADVVVVGYGDAGGSAAIAAFDAGADVLILEKMPVDKGAGGNSRVGGNMMLSFTDTEGAIKYFNGLSASWGGPVDPEMIEAWASAMVDYPNWLESIGGELGPHAGFEPEYGSLPGSESVRTYRFKKSFESSPDQNRYSPYDFLTDCVNERQIRVLYETPAPELIQDGAPKEILGVIAEQGGKTINVKAKKAVILTCGGFEGNNEMKRNYLKGQCYPKGTPYNTGDGIKMAMKVGAELWHMNNFAGPNVRGFSTPGREKAATTTFSNRVVSNNMFIWIGQDGKRFQNETRVSGHGHGNDAIYFYDATPEKLWFPRVPCWLVFNEEARLAGPILYLHIRLYMEFLLQCT